MDKENLIEVANLKKYFPVKGNRMLKAVDNVSFHIKKGETLGLVGESGCGKTTCGRTILGIYEASDGNIFYNGKNMKEMNHGEKLKFKKNAQIIFQDPYSSLDPRMTVEEIIGEGIDVHFNLSRKEKQEKIIELLDKIGLTSEFAARFPHELSGGQRQRIGIARALAVEPEFVVCDEPISALDVSIQAQILNLLLKLQKDMHLTYLFISHDLSIVKHICDRVGVMYLGAMMEIASNHDIYDKPLHPYTQALLSAIPIPDPDIEDKKQRIKLEGEVPSPINPPEGCKFNKRCPQAMAVCAKETPVLKEIEKNHFVACHLFK
jgi:oligopeptide transport system ATP-binding protein